MSMVCVCATLAAGHRSKYVCIRPRPRLNTYPALDGKRGVFIDSLSHFLSSSVSSRRIGTYPAPVPYILRTRRSTGVFPHLVICGVFSPNPGKTLFDMWDEALVNRKESRSVGKE